MKKSTIIIIILSILVIGAFILWYLFSETIVDTPEGWSNTQKVSELFDCNSNLYDCSDFDTCKEVMAVFDLCSKDVHNLDHDGDGIPCENLCG